MKTAVAKKLGSIVRRTNKYLRFLKGALILNVLVLVLMIVFKQGAFILFCGVVMHLILSLAAIAMDTRVREYKSMIDYLKTRKRTRFYDIRKVIPPRG